MRYGLSPAIVTLIVVGCRTADSAEQLRRGYHLPEGELIAVDRHRTRLDTSKFERLEPYWRQLELPTSARKIRDPEAIAVSGWPSCKIIVADASARLHVFSADARFEKSIAFHQQLPKFFPPFRVGMGSDGTIAIAESGQGWIAIAAPDKIDWVLVAPEGFVPGNRPGSAIAVSYNGAVVDHWFASGATWQTDEWQRALPLMRVLSSAGGAIGQLGSLRAYSGVSLTAAMNRGIPAVEGDSVFFATRADARIQVFPISQQWRAAPSRIIELPVSFHMRPPTELWRSSMNPVWRGVDNHLTAFAIQPHGPLYAGLILSYEKGEIPGVKPRGALGAFDREGHLLGLFDTHGVVLALAASDRLIAAVVSVGPGQGSEIRLFRSPKLSTSWQPESQEQRELNSCAD